MPTKRQRVAIVLSDDAYGAIKRLAELQGRPMSRIVADFMDQVAPTISRMCDAIGLAKKAESVLKARFVEATAKAEEDLRPLADLMAERFEELSGEFEALAQRRAGGDADAQRASAPIHRGGSDGEMSNRRKRKKDPRPVITGVTNNQKDQSNPSSKKKRA
jgi:hypothetical protein